jgi:hypothetical protein
VRAYRLLLRHGASWQRSVISVYQGQRLTLSSPKR